ncbi:MAG: DUF3848 domain-containing protein [Clostridia bacterium]|nr:DUF3848 domain-containing protein [Clostridia bacterium]
MEDKLQEKLEQELKDFKQEVKEMGVDIAVDKAYELTVKQEIIDGLLYDTNLSKKEINAILSCKKPLQKMYEDWLTQDGNLRADLNFSIDKSVNSLTSAYIKKVKNTIENTR